MSRNVAILIFDEVEVLDFAGPFEVFAVTDELRGHGTFHVYTVAPTPATVRARNGLKVVPDFTVDNCPPPSILVIPGGAGTRALMRQPSLMEWLKKRTSTAEVTLSVCTGALVLARLGLLNGLRVTTHHENLEELAAAAPGAIVDPSERFHVHAPIASRGRLVVAGGISAGIDASLHLVSTLLGPEATEATIRYMEYRAANPTGGGAP